MKIKIDLESFRSHNVLPEMLPEYEINSLRELVNILEKFHNNRPENLPSDFIEFNLPVIVYDRESDSIKLFDWMEM